MNRINPLYITAFLALLLLIVIYQHTKIEKAVSQQEHYLQTITNKAKEIATLRRYWGDKRVQKRRVATIINSPFFKRFIKNIEKSSNRVKIYLQNIDAASADSIMDKIFNSFVKVSSLKITKTDKTKISMEVEFRY